MDEQNQPSQAEEIKKLLEQNLAYSKEIYRLTKKIKSYITFQKVVSVIYVLLIVVPIILSIIYLPPLLKGVFDQYKDALGLPAGGSIQDLLKGASGGLNLNSVDLNNVDLNKLAPQVKAMLNSPR